MVKPKLNQDVIDSHEEALPYSWSEFEAVKQTKPSRRGECVLPIDQCKRILRTSDTIHRLVGEQHAQLSDGTAKLSTEVRERLVYLQGLQRELPL